MVAVLRHVVEQTAIGVFHQAESVGWRPSFCRRSCLALAVFGFATNPGDLLQDSRRHVEQKAGDVTSRCQSLERNTKSLSHNEQAAPTHVTLS